MAQLDASHDWTSLLSGELWRKVIVLVANSDDADGLRTEPWGVFKSWAGSTSQATTGVQDV